MATPSRFATMSLTQLRGEVQRWDRACAKASEARAETRRKAESVLYPWVGDGDVRKAQTKAVNACSNFARAKAALTRREKGLKPHETTETLREDKLVRIFYESKLCEEIPDIIYKWAPDVIPTKCKNYPGKPGSLSYRDPMKKWIAIAAGGIVGLVGITIIVRKSKT